MANDHLHQWPLIGASGAPPAEQGTPHVRVEDAIMNDGSGSLTITAFKCNE
jgi:hypothetical protein